MNELLLVVLVGQVVTVQVQVLDDRQEPIQGARVTMLQNEERRPPTQRTQRDGSTQFRSVLCSNEIKFVAQFASGQFSNSSRPGPCRARVPLTIRR